MKKCPFCYEDIEDQAIKCKYCSEILDENSIINPIPKKLYRSKTDRMIAGVCGGLAEYSNLDSSLIRILVVIICLFSGFFPVLIGYLLMAIIIPRKEV